MTWLSKFLRSKNCANYKLIPHASTPLLALNYNEEKIIEMYLASPHAHPTLLFKFKPRKKIRAFWSDDAHIFAVDKFGDVWKANFDQIAKTSGEPKFEELFALQTSLFSDTIDLIVSKDSKLIVQADDYYKVRVVSKENPQRLIAAHSWRPFFAFKVWEVENAFVFVFDDWNVATVSRTDLVRSDFQFDDSMLIKIEGPIKDRFFDEIVLLNDHEIAGVFWEGQNEHKSAEVMKIKVDLGHKKAKIVDIKNIKEIKDHFFLALDGHLWVDTHEAFKGN